MSLARPKCIAVFAGGELPIPDPVVLGEWHGWAPADRPHRFLVCYPPDWEAATAWLTARGAVCLPHPWDRVGVPAAHAAKLAGTPLSIAAGDDYLQAARKLPITDWPMLHPLQH